VIPQREGLTHNILIPSISRGLPFRGRNGGELDEKLNRGGGGE